MAEPELGIRFQRRFLAARQLRSFPWLVWGEQGKERTGLGW